MSLFSWKFHLIAIRLNRLSTQEYVYDDDDDDDCYFYDWGSFSGMELSLCDGKRSQSSTRTRFAIFSTHLPPCNLFGVFDQLALKIYKWSKSWRAPSPNFQN